MSTLRSVVAPLASMIRTAGIGYIAVQILIWHSFYSADPWRLTAPALAIGWGTAAIVCLRRRRWPSEFLACVDSVFYLALALGAQACVPPGVRDDAFSWLVIAISGQLIIPGWYAPGWLAVTLTFSAPAAFVAGDLAQPVTDARTLTGAAMVLIVVGLVHTFGRRELYRRAEAADSTLALAAHAAGEQYAVLARTIERREHERLLHDTVLNTLTALARGGPADPAGAVRRCRQDVTLIEDALGDRDQPGAGAGDEPGDLAGAVEAVADGLRGRGLTVHVDLVDLADGDTGGDTGGGTGGGDDAQPGSRPAVPARVAAAIAAATREALSNVAAHAGTGEAWVEVRQTAPAGGADGPGRLEVTVRDHGAGFDPERADRTRLGLRRSIAERAADCGGQATVWSAPGQGTVVRLSWPAAAGPDQPDDAPDQPARTAARRRLPQERPSW